MPFDKTRAALHRRASRAQRAWVSCAVGTLAALSVVGCASSQHDPKASSPGVRLPQAPGGIVARIGSHKISQKAYSDLFTAESKREEAPVEALPIPPHYEECVTQMRALAVKVEAHLDSDAPLRAKCKERYEALRARTLDRLITGAWIAGAAVELGLSVDSAQVRETLAASIRERFQNNAQFEQYMTRTELTSADLELETRVALLAKLIRDHIVERLGPLSRERIKAYYEGHPALHAVPESRDLEIVSAPTLELADRMKREIKAGRSFASVARGVPHQPIAAVHGLVRRYGSKGHYDQPVLDEGIFAAKPGVLHGAVPLIHGFYLFRVARVYPGYQKPFHAVEADVMKTLPGQLRKQAEAAFVSSWIVRWKPRTRCAPGYVAPLCNGSGGGVGSASLAVPGAFE